MNQASSHATTTSPAPPPVSADVGLVAALGIEVNPFLSLLKNVRKYTAYRHTVIEGELGDMIVAAVICGPGRNSARAASEVLISGHKPRWVLSAGFGGALHPDFHRNDIVLGDGVVDPEGQSLAIDIRLPIDSRQPGVHVAGVVTVDAIVRTATEKAELGTSTGASVVDMETSAVANVCAERSIKFLSVRVISDDATKDLPPEIAAILGRSGGYRVGAALGALWHRPSSIKDLWTLREHAIEASDRLAKFLPTLIAQLP